jgi:hypothetical protein
MFQRRNGSSYSSSLVLPVTRIAPKQEQNQEYSQTITSLTDLIMSAVYNYSDKNPNTVWTVLTFGCFPSVCFILADVSEPSVRSIFKGLKYTVCFTICFTVWFTVWFTVRFTVCFTIWFTICFTVWFTVWCTYVSLYDSRYASRYSSLYDSQYEVCCTVWFTVCLLQWNFKCLNCYISISCCIAAVWTDCCLGLNGEIRCPFTNICVGLICDV